MGLGFYIYRKQHWWQIRIGRDRWIPRYDANGQIYMLVRERQ